ncbi:MAG: AMP-binding protein [Micromonosporaceae bacterium]|nr:AMP-binding protein [Micromonosporaceae bacterium]
MRAPLSSTSAIDWTLAGLLASSAYRFPRHRAVAIDGESLTYRQLSDAARAMARGLMEEGVRPGDRVAVVVTNTVDWVVIRFAVAIAGATLVAVNTRLRPAEMAYIFADARPRIILVKRRVGRHDLLDRVRSALAELDRQQAGARPYRPGVFVRPWESDVGDAARDLGELFRPPDGGPEPPATSGALTPSSIANIQYTSGSSGTPKGVLLAHGPQVKNGFDFGSWLRLSPDDRFYSPGAFFHVAAGIALLGSVVAHGACLVSTETFDAEHSLRLLEGEQCTAFYATQAAVARIIGHERFAQYQLPRLQKGWFAGPETLMRATVEALGAPGLTCMYGLTEGTGVAASLPITAPIEDRLTTNGAPLPGFTIQILDPGTGAPLPPGAEGEIAIGGYAATRAYTGQAAPATATATGHPELVRTGDLGYLDKRGLLHFQGRLIELLRVAGENVAPREIEDVLLGHDEVAEVAVVRQDDERKGQVPVAFVELVRGSRLRADELLGWLGTRLADFKIPARVVFITDWPTTGSGKILRSELQRSLEPDHGAGAAPASRQQGS